jgi:ribosome-associated toxin RatA of RatAB toxin-antitoxin module
MRAFGTAVVLCAGLFLDPSARLVSAEAPPATVPAADAPIRVRSLPHPRTSVRWGRAEAVMDAPVDEVQEIVENYAQYHTFLPHFQVSRVLSQRGSSAIVYMEALVALGTVTLWAQVKMGPRKIRGGTRTIEAKMMKGNVRVLEARWELTPIDTARTEVAFQLLIEPKVPLPSAVLSYENEKASRKTLKALRRALAQAHEKTARR